MTGSLTPTQRETQSTPLNVGGSSHRASPSRASPSTLVAREILSEETIIQRNRSGSFSEGLFNPLVSSSAHGSSQRIQGAVSERALFQENVTTSSPLVQPHDPREAAIVTSSSSSPHTGKKSLEGSELDLNRFKANSQKHHGSNPDIVDEPGSSRPRSDSSSRFPIHSLPPGNIAHSSSNASANVDDSSLAFTPALIKKWNKEVGNTNHHDQCRIFLDKMRRWGGLDPVKPKEKLDIPEARKGLAILAGYTKNDIAKDSLRALIEILQEDTGKSDPDGLIETTSLLASLMKKNKIHQRTIPVQVLLAEAFCFLVNCLSIYFSKGDLNAIEKEFKKTLRKTIEGLGSLNRRRNVELKFFVRAAYEGVNLLVDDENKLATTFNILVDLATAAGKIYNTDFNSAFASLKDIAEQVNLNLEGSWYGALLVIKELAHKAISSKDSLIALLELIEKKRSQRELDWKFSYGAARILHSIAFYGENEEIRLGALNGFVMVDQDPNTNPLDSPKLLGLTSFLAGAALDEYLSCELVKYCGLPHRINPNERIMYLCVKLLEHLQDHSTDRQIRTVATSFLSNPNSPINEIEEPHLVVIPVNSPPVSRPVTAQGPAGLHQLELSQTAPIERQKSNEATGSSSSNDPPFSFAPPQSPEFVDVRSQNGFTSIHVTEV